MNQWNSQKNSRLQMFFKMDGLKIFLKRDFNIGVSCGYCGIFRITFFIEQLSWLLLTVLSQYSKVRVVVCFMISRLHVLSILIKNLHKTLHKYFLSRDRIISSFLAEIKKSINCFRFWWKTYTKRQRTFFPCILRLVKCFQFQNMIWKTEECHLRKNIELKIWR